MTVYPKEIIHQQFIQELTAEYFKMIKLKIISYEKRGQKAMEDGDFSKALKLSAKTTELHLVMRMFKSAKQRMWGKDGGYKNKQEELLWV